MNAVRATIIFISAMATTEICWFYVVRHFKNVISILQSTMNLAEVDTVAQNQIYMFTIIFVVLNLAFTGWYLYVLHSRERETTYLDLGQRGFR